MIRFEHVSLPPAIENLSLQIPPGTWLVLYGEDEFAKALFCDLCFSYIRPEAGRVHRALKGSDVSFLGRTNTTYGRSLVDHLHYGTAGVPRAALEGVVADLLGPRFARHLSPTNPLEFRAGRRAQDLELDERDWLELTEANLLLQDRPATVIDTTSDLYQLGCEQGFRHSPRFLAGAQTLIWIVGGKTVADGPWLRPPPAKHSIGLTFPRESRAGYIN